MTAAEQTHRQSEPWSRNPVRERSELLAPPVVPTDTVSSHLHASGRLDLEDLNWEKRPYNASQAYSDSKLANVLFTLELQRRLTTAGAGVRAVAVHPGMTRTNLFGHASGVQATLINALAPLVVQDPDHGAWSTLFAATDDIPGGSFVQPGGLAHMRGAPEIATPSRGAQDAAVARRMWGISARLVGIDSPLGMAVAV